MKRYRPEVLTDPNYQADEAIEPEPTIFDSCRKASL